MQSDFEDFLNCDITKKTPPKIQIFICEDFSQIFLQNFFLLSWERK